LVVATWGRGIYYVKISDLPAIVSGVTATTGAPSAAAISAVYPNPVTATNASSTVRFSVKDDSRVTLAVYDVLGRQERILANEWQQKGEHEMTADLSNIAPGQHYI